MPAVYLDYEDQSLLDNLRVETLHLFHEDAQGMVHSRVLYPENNEDGYWIRMLTTLAASSPDSLVFVRENNTLRNATTALDDVPWRVDLANLILQHFGDILTPIADLPGEWHLGMTTRFIEVPKALRNKSKYTH